MSARLLAKEAVAPPPTPLFLNTPPPLQGEEEPEHSVEALWLNANQLLQLNANQLHGPVVGGGGTRVLSRVSRLRGSQLAN